MSAYGLTGHEWRPLHVDAIPSSLLPPLAFRAAGAERVWGGGGADRGTDLGAPARLPGRQSGRNHPWPGRGAPAADPRRRNPRRISRRALRRHLRAAAVATGARRADRGPPPDELVQ